MTDELDKEIADLEALLKSSALSDEERTRADQRAHKEALRSQLAEIGRTRRADEGAMREAEARKAAAGAYLVKYVDVAALIPDLDPEKIPGKGVFVVRSPATKPRDVLGDLMREITYNGTDAKPHTKLYADLACECTVYPATTDESGIALRKFVDAFGGAAMGIGNVITDLGGLHAKEAKRGS